MLKTRRIQVCLLIILILWLAKGLRFYALDGQSLWADEGNSVVLARASLAEIAARTAFDIHPPLYYWLLHGWTRLFGESEVALRSLSACASLLLVAVSCRLGWRLFGRQAAWVAALVAAVSPFQLHYAQEARMYALLALLGGLTVWAAAEMMPGAPQSRPLGNTGLRWPGLFILSATAGLYTHYAFPVILVATGVGWLAALWRARRAGQSRHGWLTWLACLLLPVLAFVPWLPSALRQLTTWPAPASPNLADALTIVWRTLSAGPTGVDQPLVWLILPGMLGLVGLVRLPWRRSPAGSLLVVLWLGLPVALTVALFKPAYLKFLLVATPAWCLLIAAGLAAPRSPDGRRRALGKLAAIAGGMILILAAWPPMVAYFTDPAVARDDYRGLAGYLEAMSSPHDAVILNAPGQQEVFDYYYRGSAPVYPLPRARPLDEAATQSELEDIARRSRHIYAVYWATAESDPDGLIESWLIRQAFPATQWWVGNLRVALYAAPVPGGDWTSADARFGEHIRLTGRRVTAPDESDGRPALLPGDVLQVELRWQADAPLANGVVAFVQALDAAGHVAGQRDASPLAPGSTWTAGLIVLDRHGLFIPPGTPPGAYRLIAGLYDATTGARLPVQSSTNAPPDHITLATFTVRRPDVPPSPAALRLRHPTDQPAGPFRLIGYDCFKLGHDSDPDALLHSGDPLHIVLTWRAEVTPDEDWQVDLRLATGGASPAAVTGLPLAGIDYPTSCWGPGEIVRAQYDLWLPADLPAGDYSVQAQMQPTPGTPDPGTPTTRSAPLAPLHICEVHVSVQ